MSDGKYFVLQTDLTLAWFNPSWSHDFSFLVNIACYKKIKIKNFTIHTGDKQYVRVVTDSETENQ